MTDRAKGGERKGMAREIYNFVSNLEESLDKKVSVKFDFDRIMICGMGGSAIGGDIIKDSVIGEIKYPVTIQRFPELPKWVNEKTLAIVSSYSGNTIETLSMYNQAMGRNCPIIVMTSGGELEQLGIKNKQMMIKMAPGLQPRSALGMNLGYLANIMDSLCGTKCVAEIRKLIPSLIKLRDKLDGNRSEARKIAEEIQERTPIVYATAGIYASAIRWKSQINENSKMMAFAGSVPEFNHNEIMGWSEGELRDKCVLIFLYEVSAPKAIRKMADASISAMKGYGQDVKVVKIKGKSSLERILRAVMIGDYVSLYLAESRGVDPMDIHSIVEFKARISGKPPKSASGKRKTK